MGQVVPIASRERVDQAWEDYRAHAALGLENPKLLLDRAYMQRLTTLHNAFYRATLAVGREVANG